MSQIEQMEVPRISAATLTAIAQALGYDVPSFRRAWQGTHVPRPETKIATDPRVTVSPETYAKLQKMAEVDGVPIGAVIARFLDDQREQLAGAAPPPAPKPASKPKKPTAPPSASKNVN